MPLTRETLDALATLSTDELAEYVWANPKVGQEIAKHDTRVQLMDTLYADPEGKKDVQRHSRRLFPKASIPEVDIPAEIQASLKPDRDKIAALEKELGDLKLTDRRKAFRASLVTDGAADEDLDAIETFMVDNEFGVKAAKQAVAAFYETKESKEPNFNPQTVLTMPEGGGAAHIKALLEAAPGDDLDDINAPFVEQIVAEEFGGARRRATRPARA